jgi:hypothetical protein
MTKGQLAGLATIVIGIILIVWLPWWVTVLFAAVGVFAWVKLDQATKRRLQNVARQKLDR